MYEKHEMPPTEGQEQLNREVNTAAAYETVQTDEIVSEQQEMEAANQAETNPAMEAEQKEMDEGARIGRSSDYYKSQMASALRNNNSVAYKYAKRDYANALAREEAAKIERKTK